MKNPIALVFDTETIDLQDKRCFDIGWTVGNLNTGEILCNESFLVEDIFNTSIYRKAFFYNQNNSFYQAALEVNTIEVRNILAIRLAMNKAIVDYGANIISAFNIKFDINALNATYAHFNKINTDKEKEKLYKEILVASLSKKFQVIDIPLVFAHAVEAKYGKFCKEHDFLTAKGYISTKVDHINKYLVSMDYNESHTAGKDSMDEFNILYKYWGKTDKWKDGKGMAWKILKERGF